MVKNGLRKFLAVLLCIMMVFVFASCGGNSDQAETDDEQQTEEVQDQTAEEETAEEPEQAQEEAAPEEEGTEEPEQTQEEPTPEEAWEGSYAETVAGRGVITITASGDGYAINVDWSSSAAEQTNWQFTCKADGSGVMEYSDCVRTDKVFNENGEETDTVVYEDGTGRLKLDGDIIQWEDDVDNVAEDAEFKRL